MLFTTIDFAVFLSVVLSLYWSIRGHRQRKILLLFSSYLFYGWNVPWFCLLILASTITDFYVGLWIAAGRNKKRCLAVSLIVNLGLLTVFKYNNFFIANFSLLFSRIGFNLHVPSLEILLPVGISFYTFQTLSYSIDVYRGAIESRRDFVDFALFVSFFPQLVAGPIERAQRLIPQIEAEKKWDWNFFDSSWPLIIRGLFKKMVIADNVAVFVDKIFLLDQPGLWFLMVGTFAFSVQICMDFSGYTDIARGVARLFGFNLMKNFNLPYLAITPSDFWRRWHISLSSWIKDYVYISFGGNRHKNTLLHGVVIMSTMLLSGLWHGAAWNFIFWGVYHGILLISYHRLGKGGQWKPGSYLGFVVAWLLMFVFIQLGWLLFRAPDLAWLIAAVRGVTMNVTIDELAICLYILMSTFMLCLPICVLLVVERLDAKMLVFKPIYNALLVSLIFLFHSRNGGDFIYFQF